jgi:polysaccharide export outer membrane protein
MTILLRFMLAALLALPLAFSQGAQAQEYRIQSGDRLAIEVLEDASLNRTVTVLPGGTIDFPYAAAFGSRASRPRRSAAPSASRWRASWPPRRRSS